MSDDLFQWKAFKSPLYHKKMYFVNDWLETKGEKIFKINFSRYIDFLSRPLWNVVAHYIPEKATKQLQFTHVIFHMQLI